MFPDCSLFLKYVAASSACGIDRVANIIFSNCTDYVRLFSIVNIHEIFSAVGAC